MRFGWRTAALAAALIVGPAQADTKAGVDAWQRGDYRTAVEQWKQAARSGDADAQYNLGQAYKMGRGVPVDLAAAESWYGKAAAQGHVEAEDSYGLALFQNNRPRDAVPYLEMSVARGEPRAQYILGTMLFNGIDIKKDWPRAYALTSRAAAAGLPQATQSLQQMDTYLNARDRQEGLALADRMAAAQPTASLPSDAGGHAPSTAMRSVELPPSDAGRPTYSGGRIPVPPPAYPQAGTRAAVPAPTPRPVRATPVPVAVAAGGWRLQLGAFGDVGNARRLGGQLAARFAGRRVDYVKAGALTKVMVGPFASKAAALAACGSVSPCVPVGP